MLADALGYYLGRKLGQAQRAEQENADAYDRDWVRIGQLTNDASASPELRNAAFDQLAKMEKIRRHAYNASQAQGANTLIAQYQKQADQQRQQLQQNYSQPQMLPPAPPPQAQPIQQPAVSMEGGPEAPAVEMPGTAPPPPPPPSLPGPGLAPDSTANFGAYDPRWQAHSIAQQAEMMQKAGLDPTQAFNIATGKGASYAPGSAGNQWDIEFSPGGMNAFLLKKSSGEYKDIPIKAPPGRAAALLPGEIGQRMVAQAIVDSPDSTPEQKKQAQLLLDKLSRDTSSGGSFEEKMFQQYVADFKSVNGTNPNPSQMKALRIMQLVDEQKARTPDELEALRKTNLALLNRILNVPNATIESVSGMVQRGELTPPQAVQMLGGQRGGLAPNLIQQIGQSGNRILVPKQREALNNVNIGMAQIDKVEQLVNRVIASKDSRERIENTKLLEDYGNTITARLARANGEVGMLTEQDVNRAKGLVAGWKAANFNPQYAKKELGLIRENYAAVKNAIQNQYFETVPAAGAPPPPPSQQSIQVISPEGKRGTIPADKWSDAEKRGFKRVQ